MNKFRLFLFSALITALPLAYAERRGMTQHATPIQRIANHISSEWVVLHVDSLDGSHFERRMSKPYRRYSMCARSVIEAEAPTPSNLAIDDDDIVDAIRLYRVYAPPLSGCDARVESYFPIAFDGTDEVVGVDLIGSLIQRRWREALKTDESPEFVFSGEFSAKLKRCLLDDRASLRVVAARIAPHDKALSVKILIGSCAAIQSRVALLVTTKGRPRVEFKTVPTEIEG